MEKLFRSVFLSGYSLQAFFLTFGIALVSGVIFAFMCYIKTKSSKSFFITTSLIPATVAMVIVLVNGNLGVGVAVAGAFSLVRFRSAPGNAKEICIIFVAMAAGLAFGMGYIAYATLFMLISGTILIVFSLTKIFEGKPNLKEKKLVITIPEDLDYTTVFEDILNQYTVKHELLKVKTTNMGSMFRISYNVILKDVTLEKEFIDSLRCRNGNLEISLERTDIEPREL